jgi:CubicO group peptidase (beta-lactamase class C family)
VSAEDEYGANEHPMTTPTNPVVDQLPPTLTRGGGDDGDSSLTYEATVADARAEILKELDKSENKPSAVTVALVDDQRILWAEAFGSIDQTQDLAPTTETLFCIASCSKVIAAVAVMILVDRGMVDLDSPVVRYVSDFRMADGEAYSDITVRMLLSHSSGLHGTHFPNILTIVPVPGYATQFRDALATERLKHAPGEMAAYCNDGFTLIELVVAAVTGQLYTDFVKKEILEPLGMSHSRFALERFDPGTFAPTLDSVGRPEPQEYVNVYASGLFSTPSDMGRLAMMLLNGGRLGDRHLLSTEAVAEMGRDQTVNLPLNPITDHYVHFGLGWDGIRQGGLAAVGVDSWYKGGDADHYHSYFIVAPEERLAVVVMVTNGFANALAERILLNALAERGSIAKVPPPLEPVALPAIPVSDEDLAAIAGIYASAYCPRRLEPQADRTLTLSTFTNGQWQPSIEGLKLRQDGRFVAHNHPETAYRSVVAAGRRYLAVRRPNGFGHYEIELPDSHDLPTGRPLSARWQARVGRRWLMVNHPYSAFLALGRQRPLFSLGQVEGLDGYLAASLTDAGMDLVQVVDPRESDHIARMCLKIPIDNGWGLSDLMIVDRDCEEWVLWDSTLYRPLETVAVLGLGQDMVTIGHEGLGEWRRLPANSALTLGGASTWYLYNAEFTLLAWGLKEGTRGEVDAGAYLLLHSSPNTTITLTMKP